LILLALTSTAQAAGSGEAVFKRNCAICHSTEPGHNKVGPSLGGVVGRPAGSVADFSYSTANRTSGIVWTREELDAYLANPQAVVPGTLMAFPGLKAEPDRKALIDYLADQPGS